MPIAEESKHLTTFITEWGTFEYNVLPQGHKTSKDVYDRRFTNALDDFKDYEKVVDDVLKHNKANREHWWEILRMLTDLGKRG